MWDFEFEADAASGIVLQVVQPIHASGVFPAPPWLKGVRVHANGNAIDALLVGGKETIEAPIAALSRTTRAGNVIYTRTIASYDDSFQPIGFCGFGSIKMKKLHHELTCHGRRS
ncbi:MAG: hypothetical protein IPL70_14500 [Uliginosibacterium sp.]|nr:hypothetical protein [Uliginosibacterium sp.]